VAPASGPTWRLTKRSDHGKGLDSAGFGFTLVGSDQGAASQYRAENKHRIRQSKENVDLVAEIPCAH
jgi:hypothetical protein